jgi:putative sigma-54 modulation protein
MDLKVEIYARNMEVTDRITEYVTKKVGKFDKFLSTLEEARVDLSYNKAARSAADRQTAQITLRGRGVILRTEERADDLFAAIDTAVDRMQRQVERYKGKHLLNTRGDGKSAAEVVEEKIEEEPSMLLRIAKRKSFRLHPMDENEALEQMVLLGHENFFVFYNANTSAINVLYHRRDGTYGLIEPEVG